MSLAPRKSVREQVDPAQHVPVDPNVFVGDAAKEIVRLNRGSIMLDRAPAGGLRVKVELPATGRRSDNSLT